MNRLRGEFGGPSGPTGGPPQQQQAAKPNRLRRSFRRTEAAAEESREAEFKTPTRIQTSRASGCFSGESPHNDSDLLQDIIWDATSPSPSRLGKRGKKQQPRGAVDISEIVSRIAPKHGRPRVSEPTLQQWIGDSASIPCTPDVQAAKPRKKSPRPNGVDDLLKLAKQFDCNMFGQEEEEEQEEEEQEEEEEEEEEHLELLSDDIFDGDRSDASPPPAAGKEVRRHAVDDLDLLFDGPTQRVSGTISQPSQLKAAAREAPGKPAATATANAASAGDVFEDDWESDDLLNDSLMLELTQNPQSFSCSTQKVPARPRATFRLDPFPAGGSKAFPAGAGSSAETGSRQTANAAKSDPPAGGSKPKPKPPPPAVLLDEDLSSFFPSDPVWDDLADDDLLCELCEDLENQIRAGANGTQRPADLQPFPQKPALTNAVTDSSGRTQAKSTCGPAGGRAAVQSAAAPGNDRKHQFTFRTPSGPVTTATSGVVAKCSAAEIEQKKQQAMERRRRRLQAVQNLRAPT